MGNSGAVTLRTSLYDKHRALGGRLVEFAGWEMPVQYAGIIQEHQAVRNAAGIFDVSHMGRIMIEGPDAEAFVDFVSANKIAGKKPGTATYTVFANEQGGSVDDAIIYCYSPEKYSTIVNAGNRDKDLQHLKNVSQDYAVEIRDHYDDHGILAVQGPKAVAIVERVIPGVGDLKRMRFADFDYSGVAVTVASTGYTGAGGLELCAHQSTIDDLWDKLLSVGEVDGLVPAGLGARDTLRMEMGFALYGHELSDSIAATESVSAWTVKLSKPQFLGKVALEKLEESPHKRCQYGAILDDKGIAREGCSVFREGKQIGVVSSGGHSPSLNKAIAIVMVGEDLAVGDRIEIQVRKNQLAATIVELPFYRQ